MFEDNKQQPEDIFAQVDDTSQQPAQPPQAPRPQQSQSQSAPQQQPAQQSPQPPAAGPANSSMASQQPPAGGLDIQTPPHSGGGSRTWLVVLIVIVIAAVVAVGGWFAYQQFVAPMMDASPTPQPAVTDTTNANRQPLNDDLMADEDVVMPSDDVMMVEDDTTAPVVVDRDSDLDGLSDRQEDALGTDPRLADTDLDGLFDQEEVNVYETDPLDNDTDGDGFLDGEEVKNGYDPNGPGRLFEPTS